MHTNYDFEFLRNYLKIFKVYKDTKIILTLRDPLVSLCSTINHWLKYKEGIFLTPRAMHRKFDTHFNIFNNINNFLHKITPLHI